jgi:hypothetical protein
LEEYNTYLAVGGGVDDGVEIADGDTVCVDNPAFPSTYLIINSGQRVLKHGRCFHIGLVWSSGS